ncbi:four and a half LIM domains protein 2-like isoform X2 [Centruroides sculpturatus]|uniref:four and a half LIM domains protein 2-like isoform X2 n=1 Tax=Centruroides sculpturatus TaxID=218467 RepID=UPI000C6D1EDC|nr:four and a half LIM domains protein 2-like isoform X2 [Centruroides sculpturatus]
MERKDNTLSIEMKDQHEQNRMLKQTASEECYSWVPSDLSADKIQLYFTQIPWEKVPRIGTCGEKYREQQIIIQLPKQDFSANSCKFLEKEYRKHYDDFLCERNKTAMDIAYITGGLEHTSYCYGCEGIMILGDLAVINSRLGENNPFHPGCFVCSVCKELLVDLVSCTVDGKIYCERHYAEEIKPRCAACDELIFDGKYIRAMSKDWHTIHFCCWKCNESLTGQRYLIRDDQPFCVHCYEKLYSDICNECGKSIGVDSEHLSYKDKHWHESCFSCNNCHTSLINKVFGSKADQVYCAICYESDFATKCECCGEVLKAGTRKMEYEDKQWHENCFLCVVCANFIGNKSFIQKDNNIYCPSCYEKKFSVHCIKCCQVIATHGVTHRNKHWHRECFSCTSCQRVLAGQRFTFRDEKPYCAQCFGELFAKRCNTCNRPITGIGETRFLSFGDRNWHCNCFLCAVCERSLVEKGFIADGRAIFCLECDKQIVNLTN